MAMMACSCYSVSSQRRRSWRRRKRDTPSLHLPLLLLVLVLLLNKANSFQAIPPLPRTSSVTTHITRERAPLALFFYDETFPRRPFKTNKIQSTSSDENDFLNNYNNDSDDGFNKTTNGQDVGSVTGTGATAEGTTDASSSPPPVRLPMSVRKRVANLARNLVIKPISYAAPMPQAIASVLKEATLSAVDMAVEEVIKTREQQQQRKNQKKKQHHHGHNSNSGGDENSSTLLLDDEFALLIEEAFAPLEKSLTELEESLQSARKHMNEAKSHALDAITAVQAAALAQAEGAATAVAAAEDKVIQEIFASTTVPTTVTSTSTTKARENGGMKKLLWEEVDFDTYSDMAPPFLDEDQCLVPGKPIVRVEKAPENSRRIFAGVDIMASVDDVWNVLTDYANLQQVVPNLVVNEVMARYDGSNTRNDDVMNNAELPVEVQCQAISKRMKGALLRQVGGAKVAGINFSARTKLEVREWPQGMPDFAHFNDAIWEGKSRQQRAKEYSKIRLQRYRFPRPFAISSLPTRDISMQSIENDDGEFRMYQGVWRLTPLPGCAPPGKEAMRLTYAVEVSPRAYLPVQLIEGRIVRDLCTNLEAIRDFVSSSSASLPSPSSSASSLS